MSFNVEVFYVSDEERAFFAPMMPEEVLDAILNEDLQKMDLSSDAAIAEKSVTFELMKKKVDAYQTLLKAEPSYFQSRGKKVKESVESKLKKMKLVCD